MGIDIGVNRVDEHGEPDPDLVMPTEAVMALLGQFFSDDPDFVAPHDPEVATALMWVGERLRSQWSIYGDQRGVSSVDIQVFDDFPDRPTAEYQDELRTALHILREVATAAGARLFIGSDDFTDVSMQETLDFIAPVKVESAKPGQPRVSRKQALAQAEVYLAQYLAFSPIRLAWLGEHCAQTGGPLPGQLDFSRDSLVPLWTWAMTRFQLRSADAPMDYVVLPKRRYPRPRDADLPMWFGRDGSPAPAVWSDESLAVLDGIAYYLAECLLRAVPTARWDIDRRKGNNEGHQPVIIGFTYPINLIDRVQWLLGPMYHLHKPDPADLRQPPAAKDVQDMFDSQMSFAPPQ